MDYITSCVSALLFCGACCGNPTTHGKERETASGGTHIWDICFPSDWATLQEEEMTALCHTPPTPQTQVMSDYCSWKSVGFDVVWYQ